MGSNEPTSLEFSQQVCQKHWKIYNILDDAQLETRCPLDNGRHDCTVSALTGTSLRLAANAISLDRLPLELRIEVVLRMDIPALTRLRGLSRRTMALVNMVPEYAAIIKHCPNIVRAIVSIEADGFDCLTLFNTLSTSRCATCDRFGYRFYLISCLRVCYYCSIRRPEYLPLTRREAYSFFVANANLERTSRKSRKLFASANLPSILSLPGRYSYSHKTKMGLLRPKRLRLYDRQAVLGPDLEAAGLAADYSLRFLRIDKVMTVEDPKRHMAIITAPVLLNGGRQVDHGFFCHGCYDVYDQHDRLICHFLFKHTTEEIHRHMETHGRVIRVTEMSGFRKFVHERKYRRITS